MKFKIVAYDKAGNYFAERPLYAYQYSAAFEEFNKYVDFLTSGKFHYIGRIDFVSAGRVLFSLVALYHIVDQKNYTVNFNPF